MADYEYITEQAKKSIFNENAGEGTFQNETDNTLLAELSEIYDCFYGCPSPDYRTERDFAQEAEDAPREPGAFFKLFDPTKATPSDECWLQKEIKGDLRHPEAWYEVGPVEGPHTKKMSSLEPSLKQQRVERKLCRETRSLFVETWNAFREDYYPTEGTLAILLAVLSENNPVRPLVQELWNVHYPSRYASCPTRTGEARYSPASPTFDDSTPMPVYGNRSRDEAEDPTETKRQKRASTPTM